MTTVWGVAPWLDPWRKATEPTLRRTPMQLPACDLAQVGDVTVMRDTAASIDVPDVFVPLMRAAMEEAVARDLEAVIFGY
ncbi:MAG: hypothetical protein V2J02_08590, partial [Pseudomonadales bacterium]|nr:hypothetical protein [Pseudomonadales bacterium]